MAGASPPRNPYTPVECVHNFERMRKALRGYEIAWEKWGKELLLALDALKGAPGGGMPGPPRSSPAAARL